MLLDLVAKCHLCRCYQPTCRIERPSRLITYDSQICHYTSYNPCVQLYQMYVGKIGNQLSKCSLDQIGRREKIEVPDAVLLAARWWTCHKWSTLLMSCLWLHAQAHVQYVYMNLSNMINTIYAEHAIYRDLLTSWFTLLKQSFQSDRAQPLALFS